jgi:hypothetical protein
MPTNMFYTNGIEIGKKMNQTWLALTLKLVKSMVYTLSEVECAAGTCVFIDMHPFSLLL